MEFYILLLVGLTIVSGVILPWVNHRDIRFLRTEIVRLNRIVLELRGVAKPSEEPLLKEDFPVPETEPKASPVVRPAFKKPAFLTPAHNPQQSKTINKPVKKKVSLEQQFGARLPVWIGGISLALAGLFMVKYSLDNNLVSPQLRLIVGALFGLLLLKGGAVIRARETVANGTRIAQSLSGAGICILYLVMFAATSLYGFLPDIIGFVGMAVITALAVVSSLRYGMPIAVLGLLGGFLTPMLINSDAPSAPLLFGYLYILFSGFLHIMRKQNWWFLSLPMLLAVLGWTGLWLFSSHFATGDALWLGLFLIGISATVVYNTKDNGDGDLLNPASILSYLGLTASIIMMGFIASTAELTVMSWGDVYFAGSCRRCAGLV